MESSRDTIDVVRSVEGYLYELEYDSLYMLLYTTIEDVIGRCMFDKMPYLEEVVLPYSLQEISPFAFFDCPKLRRVCYPATSAGIRIFEANGDRFPLTARDESELYARFVNCDQNIRFEPYGERVKWPKVRFTYNSRPAEYIGRGEFERFDTTVHMTQNSLIRVNYDLEIIVEANAHVDIDFKAKTASGAPLTTAYSNYCASIRPLANNLERLNYDIQREWRGDSIIAMERRIGQAKSEILSHLVRACIENKTTVTFLLRNEIQEVVEIPLGMDDILDKLAEKYNSYAKAYEACKKVSVYIEDVSTLDDESRDILDVVLPIFYDIRQRVDEVVAPYKRMIKAIYLAGAALAVNNVDVYFQENFPGLRCETLKPYFMSQRDRENQNEITQMASAIAIALNGLGMLDPSVDFSSAAKKALKPSPIREAIGKLKLKDKVEDFKTGLKEKKEAFRAKKNTPKRLRRAGGDLSFFDRISDFVKEKFHIGKKKAKVSFDDSGFADRDDVCNSSRRFWR